MYSDAYSIYKHHIRILHFGILSKIHYSWIAPLAILLVRMVRSHYRLYTFL